MSWFIVLEKFFWMVIIILVIIKIKYVIIILIMMILILYNIVYKKFNNYFVGDIV